MDLSKLSESQLDIAERIVAEANKQNVDPNLALAIAYQESRFNPKAQSNRGAYGVMQLMPETAKSLGVNIMDMDDNIRGGISYLKSNLDKFDNNLVHAVAAYNAGPNSKFLETKNFGDLPDETVNYLDQINQVYPLEPKKQEVTPESSSTTSYATSEQEPILWGIGGAGAGYAKGRAEQSYNQKRGVLPPAQQPSTAGSSGSKWAQKTGYGVGEGSVRDVSERYQKQFRDIGKGARQVKGARLMNVDEALEEIRRKEQLAKRAMPLKGVENIGRFTSHFPKLSGALGGFGVGAEGAEAYNRWEREDYPGAVISGLGALGSLASMVPATTLPTAIVKGAGTAVGALSPLALQAYDYLREKTSD